MKYIKSYENNEITIYGLYSEDKDGITSNTNLDSIILNIKDMSDKHKKIYKTYKFKLLDYVRYIGNKYTKLKKDKIYQIRLIDVNDVTSYGIYERDTDEFINWVTKYDIVEVDKYEIDAEKYNL